jgi:putative PIN family toxin of toxin-antitoxin system
MTTETRPIVVLDTNVVLDWLVFSDPLGCHIGEQITRGELRWIGTSTMRDELSCVLRYPVIEARWSPRLSCDEILARHDAYVHTVEPAAPVADTADSAIPRMRCRDPDDQPFIDLALQHRAHLISRDLAVLKLARRARTQGAEILTPQQWLRRPQLQA